MHNSQTSDFRILTWNCRQLKNKSDELTTHSTVYNVIICTETWLMPNMNLTLPGHNKKRPNSLQRRRNPYRRQKTYIMEHPAQHNSS
ncbi:hypothetical protein QLX08_003841 [Tetragonisca angustula]|uniref:Uncharacterized protein n=1 Tax=Tetragonisca angustula TaxID=166442 RepID=A0AAW1A4N1_9HYME